MFRAKPLPGFCRIFLGHGDPELDIEAVGSPGTAVAVVHKVWGSPDRIVNEVRARFHDGIRSSMVMLTRLLLAHSIRTF